MKVIDLLNKITNCEEVPKKIKFENKVYVLDHEGLDFYALEEGYGLLLEKINDTNLLNVEVEIIEEVKEIRELPNEIQYPRNFDEVVYIAEDLVRKINELTKTVNYLLDKEKE